MQTELISNLLNYNIIKRVEYPHLAIETFSVKQVVATRSSKIKALGYLAKIYAFV